MRSVGIMRLVVKGLGPIREACVELGDVTVLLGYPNTGKSYTLKAIYSRLAVLDEYTRSFIVYNAIGALRFREGLEEATIGVLRDLLSLFLGLVYVVGVLDVIASETLVRASELLRKCLNIESVVIGLDKDELRFKLQQPIVVEIGFSDISSSLMEGVQRVSEKILPIEKSTYVSLEPIDVAKIVDEGTLFAYVQGLEGRHSIPLRRVYEELFHRAVNRLVNIVSVRPTRIYAISSAISRSAVLNVDYRFDVDWHKSVVRVVLYPSIVVSLVETGRHLRKAGSISMVTEKVCRYLLGEMVRPNSLVDFLARGILSRLAYVLARSLVSRLVESIARVITSRLGVESVRFVPFGRSLLVQSLGYVAAEPFERALILKKVGESFGLIPSSFLYWISRGRAALIEGRFDSDLVKVFRLVLEGSVEAGYNRPLTYTDWRGVEVPIHFASALAEEVAGLLLSTVSLEKKQGLLLVEEPEAQLHPSAQIVMGLVLAALPELTGCRLVVSTHSDILAVTLGYIAQLRPKREDIVLLIERLLPHIYDRFREEVEVLSNAVAQSAENLDIKMYFFDRSGKVENISTLNVLEKVPGITDAITTLASWAMTIGAKEGG